MLSWRDASRDLRSYCILLARRVDRLYDSRSLCAAIGMRRLTRFTNGHSKKRENHEAAWALWFAFYNFCRKHETWRMTPAQAAG